jgi:hypothetical protein
MKSIDLNSRLNISYASNIPYKKQPSIQVLDARLFMCFLEVRRFTSWELQLVLPVQPERQEPEQPEQQEQIRPALQVSWVPPFCKQL